MTFKLIYELVRQIPRGKVFTYKKIAEFCKIKDIRTVGFALHQNKSPQTIPCQRVVRSDGTLAEGYAFGGKKEQLRKLKQEEVRFISKDKVDLNNSLWQYEKSHI